MSAGNPDSVKCPHEDFVAVVDVIRIDNGGGLEALSVEVKVHCQECGEPLVFRGLPIGLDQRQPMISPDGTELRAPGRMQSHDPHFGLGLPGFVARVREGAPEGRN